MLGTVPASIVQTAVQPSVPLSLEDPVCLWKTQCKWGNLGCKMVVWTLKSPHITFQAPDDDPIVVDTVDPEL